MLHVLIVPCTGVFRSQRRGAQQTGACAYTDACLLRIKYALNCGAVLFLPYASAKRNITPHAICKPVARHECKPGVSHQTSLFLQIDNFKSDEEMERKRMARATAAQAVVCI